MRPGNLEVGGPQLETDSVNGPTSYEVAAGNNRRKYLRVLLKRLDFEQNSNQLKTLILSTKLIFSNTAALLYTTVDGLF